MAVHEDLDDIKQAKERADHRGQLAKLQVGLLEHDRVTLKRIQR